MRAGRVVPWVILVLSISFLFQAILSVWDDSPTFDETINPSVGYVELFTGDLGYVHDHPPLYRVFMALPLLAFQPNIPLQHASWQKRQQGMLDRYEFAHEFFYVANKNADTLLFWSRAPVVLLSLLLGLLVFQWAKELYGNSAALFAFFLYTFEPNIIAHSRLATNDLVLTLFVFSTVYQFWQYSNSLSVRDLALTGILLGLALVSKFSAVILFPILFFLAFLRHAEKMSEDFSAPWTTASKMTNLLRLVRRSLPGLGLIFIVAVGVLFFFYGTQWKQYIRGFWDTLVHYREGHRAFLMGNYSTSGWWYYFPVAFLLKTPVPFLIYLLIACLLPNHKKGTATYFLLIPVAVVFSTALLSHINIGLRHILPVYPFLIVLASSLTALQFSHPRFYLGCFAALAIWYVSSTLSVFPSYLAYFNDFVGPRGGYQWLADSNLDWGQDLRRLKVFMDKKKIDKIYLSYFGTADPCYYDIRFIYLPDFPSDCGERPEDSTADFIAVSATHLQSVYLLDKKSFEWLKDYKPMAQIGYSIFVFDIQGDAFAHNSLGILYLKYRMLDEALSEFKRVVKLAPEDTTAHANLGFTYGLLSDFDNAKEAYTKALKLDPGNDLAREGLKALKGSS